MKTKNKILTGIVIATLVAMVCFYIYLPILFIGPIEPLQFRACNYDDIYEHNITVEIFDYKNKSIFKETYELGPKEVIGSPGITKRRGKYTIKVTVDDKITHTSKANVGYGQYEVLIRLYSKNPPGSEKIVPIVIVQKVV
ncbi:MAG: hypothetical protein U9N61_09245 [Euryarchaeota archaeon]|nr:hypothetical protein [Euryarchaeota archaeon]MEA1999486.1 hypothetical protein [Euryarchaeota archaeon]